MLRRLQAIVNLQEALRRLAGGSRWPDVMLAIMCALMVAQGIRTTRSLDWPPDADLYRDIAQAQTIRNGQFFADPFYLDEKAWYSPLVPWLVAAFSWVTDAPVHVVGTRLGAYLNLAGIISFYAILLFFFDRWVAVAGISGFLFVIGNGLPDWASAGYSPSLFTAKVVQCMFYLSLLAYGKAIQWAQKRGRGSPPWHDYGVGVLLGSTLLGHVVPAILLGAIIGSVTLQMAVANRAWKPAIAGLLRTVATAFLVGMPLLHTILFHYHLQILNPAPNTWVYGDLAVSNIPNFLSRYLSVVGLICLLGLIYAIKNLHGYNRTMLFTWFCVGCAGLGYDWLRQQLQAVGMEIPGIVPGWHFLFYLMALEALLFGCGLVFLAHLLVGAIGQLSYRPKHWRERSVSRRRTAEHLVAGLLLLVPVAGAYPDFGSQRWMPVYEEARAQRKGQVQDDAAIFSWIAAHAPTNSVFLASDDIGLHAVGPSGRKVVAVGEVWSNPYVDWLQRKSDRDAMFADLVAHYNRSAFLRLASDYRLGYVIGSGGECDVLGSRDVLSLVFSTQTSCVLELQR